MPEFAVQPEALAQAGAQASRLASDVGGLLREVRGDGTVLPGLTVEPALADLLSSLQSGLAGLADALGRHGAALSDAAGAYRDTDSQVAGAADRLGSGASVEPPP